MMHRCKTSLIAAIGLLVGLTASGPVRASEPLVADVDNHLVAVTAGFTGTELLVFGSVQGAGEVVIVVHGPKQEVAVRRKDRVAGIWINQESIGFEGVPAFYHVATTASGPIDLPGSALRRHQIGVDNLRFRTAEAEDGPGSVLFAQALIRNKINVGHYSARFGRVERRGGRLFRSAILIPANVPVGTYTIETLLVQNGQVVGAQTTPLFVNKEGFGAQVFRMAHLHALLYGIAAILIAALAGFVANWVFRKL
ncbi:MAG: TIGR02186 family protein [Alphaproteobacteria bacterium]|nr:TIGR02186 family protein [Alphaproteobacteria bacterium]